MVVWHRKRRSEKDQHTLIHQHSVSFLSIRAIWSSLPSSSSVNETNTRQLHYTPPHQPPSHPCLCKDSMQTLFHFLSLIHHKKQRLVWDMWDHSEVNDSTKTQQYALKWLAFLCVIFWQEWVGLWYFFLTAGWFKISYSVFHLKKKKHLLYWLLTSLASRLWYSMLKSHLFKGKFWSNADISPGMLMYFPFQGNVKWPGLERAKEQL